MEPTSTPDRGEDVDRRFGAEPPPARFPGIGSPPVRSAGRIVLACAVLFAGWCGTPPAQAQAAGSRPTVPRIGYAYPAGGRQGSTFNVTVGGQLLGENTVAEFSGAGVRARFLGFQRPLNQLEIDALKEEGEKLREKRQASRRKDGPVWTPQDEARAMELREKSSYRPGRQSAPAIAEAVSFEVTIAADAAPGQRELRLRTGNGLSSPVVFWVETLPEFSEPAASPNTAIGEPRNPGQPLPRPKPSERTVALPAVVNGQIMPGEVDRIRFAAKAGQKITIAAGARALIPYLADAVPGWFQATLALFDAKGAELAYDDDFRFNPDPVLFHQIRADGDYVVEIKDAIYRGRQDFVYRITIGEFPFVTSIFPLGGQAGRKTEMEIRGWNLPAVQCASYDATHDQPGQVALMVDNALSTASVPFAIDRDPDCLEVEPNGGAGAAQPLKLPIVVNGRIDRPGDCDVFSFEGRAGEEIVVEVVARRLNSPLDSNLQVTDPTGKAIAANDDHEDKGAGLTTHHADSLVAVKLPADGRYCVHLGDTQHQGGPEFGYRLHLRQLRPDFKLRVVPSSLNLRTGAHLPVTVYALRQDGFAGEIELGVGDPSGRFAVAGARIPAGQDKVRLTLATSAPPREEAYRLSVVGRATIAGSTVGRIAVPAEDRMQAFAYRHLVPAQELKAQVIGGGRAPAGALRLVDKVPLRIPAGGSVRFRVAVNLGKMFEKIRAELDEPPDGITIRTATEGPGTMEVTFSADSAKVKPGQKGNLILMTTGERPGAAEKKADKAKAANRVRVPLSALPAIPFEIVAK